MDIAPPKIFSQQRRIARQARACSGAGAAQFVIDDMVAETIERLDFLGHPIGKALVIGDWTGALADALARRGHTVTAASIADIDEQSPFPATGLGLIVSLAALDTVNDLPGALIHMRATLAPGGLAIASMVGGASLTRMRRALIEAEGDRPAARMHPLVDPRSCPGLLQRAGWKDPVVDTQELAVRYSSLDRLVQDLRDQGLGNVLASPAPPLTRTVWQRARAAFLAQADGDGKVCETIAIITLTGRR